MNHVPDNQLSLLLIHLRRVHSQTAKGRLQAGVTVAYSQKNGFFNPGEQAQLQRVNLLILTVPKLNSVSNIKECPR